MHPLARRRSHPATRPIPGKAAIAPIIAKRLPEADSEEATARIAEAARWYAALKAGENALPHKSRTALKSGEALVRRLRRWLSTNGADGTTIGEMLRWAAAKRVAGGGSSARAGPGAWAAEHQARRLLALRQALLAGPDPSIAPAVAIPHRRPRSHTSSAP